MEEEASLPQKPKSIEETKVEVNHHGHRRFPPLETRLLLYERALLLKKRYYTYQQIIDDIEREHKVKVCKSTISSWVKGLSSPFRAGHMFVPKPSPELAYVIGVETGDAFLNVKKKTYQYRIRLRAVDKEFVEAFNQAVSKVLGCPPHKLWKGKHERETLVEFGSYFLHKSLSQDFQELKPFVEFDKSCVAAFLRGFFDSEGSVSREGYLTASNTDLDLLDFVQYLLGKYFGVQATGPHQGKRKGTILTRRGRSYVRNAGCFSLYVRTANLMTFYREIGLTIERKKVRLEKRLGLIAIPEE